MRHAEVGNTNTTEGRDTDDGAAAEAVSCTADGADHGERLAPLFSSASPEWYTPREVLDAVLACLQDIELDPCSNSHTAPNVPAAHHFTAADDGLAQDWSARTLFLNPPYGRTISAWVNKLLDAYATGRVQEAVALLPARTDTAWFRPLFAFPICYIHGRLRFSHSANPAPFPSALVYLGPDPDRFREAVAPLGSVSGPSTEPPEALPAPARGGDAPADEPAARYQLVSTSEKLLAAQNAVEESLRIGLDLETTGLNPRRDRIRLLSLATDRGIFLVDCFAVDPRPLLDLLAQRELVIHHAAFDLAFLASLGFTPAGKVYDTMLLAQLLMAGTRERVTLAACCQRWLQRSLDKTEQKSDWSGTLRDDQLDYAARDVEVLAPLLRVLVNQITQAGLIEVAQIERRCLLALVWMGQHGVGFDQPTWQSLAQTASDEAERLREELHQVAPPKPGTWLFPEPWNWDSPQQAQQALALAGCDVPNTSDESLAAVQHPVPQLLRRYRLARKRSSTYGHTWLEHVASDGRVYPGWRQIGAASGRMSCSHPNMQQLPRGDYRRCVVAPPGRVLVKADYSQIELRIAAKVSGDPALLEAYQRGDDLHTRTARAVLGIEAVTKEHRQLAKALNFGLLYGMGAKGLQIYAKSQYGLELTEAEAQRYRAALFQSYPGLAAWHRRIGRTRDQVVETRTLAGRRRLEVARFTEKLNTPVQGTGADGLKLALALLWERREQVPSAFPVLAVHDEIVLECDASQAEAAAAWVQQAMVEAMAPLIDPVAVEVEVKVARN